MISPENFFNALTACGIEFFAGVPDSLLKDFNAYVTDQVGKIKHTIAANEGGAVALASGHYLGTGKPAVVYMQNSGLGNAVNPLASLAHGNVYQIPMILLVGWRGEPDKPDEPQHKVQGEITLQLLDLLKIPYEILPDNDEAAVAAVNRSYQKTIELSSPVALVVQKGTFDKYQRTTQLSESYPLSREAALEVIVDHVKDGIFVATTGKLSRELFELREGKGMGHERDFLTVGSMGHASQIALGLSAAQSDRRVYCLDGDGAAIMHLGSFAIIGQAQPKNLCHIVFNNGAHDSVGGQPTAGFTIDFTKIASACSYPITFSVQTREELIAALNDGALSKALSFIEIKINTENRSELGRPTTTPVENKEKFMHNIIADGDDI